MEIVICVLLKMEIQQKFKTLSFTHRVPTPVQEHTCTSSRQNRRPEQNTDWAPRTAPNPSHPESHSRVGGDTDISTKIQPEQSKMCRERPRGTCETPSVTPAVFQTAPQTSWRVTRQSLRTEQWGKNLSKTQNHPVTIPNRYTISVQVCIIWHITRNLYCTHTFLIQLVALMGNSWYTRFCPCFTFRQAGLK